MPARLFSQWGETRGVSQDFDDELTIGRRETNGLVLDFAAVSGEHARIRFDERDDCYVLEDLGSLNGTKVDGIRVVEPMRLGRLNVLKFGRVCEFVFQRLTDAPGDTSPPPAEGFETELIDVQLPPEPPLPDGGD